MINCVYHCPLINNDGCFLTIPIWWQACVTKHSLRNSFTHYPKPQNLLVKQVLISMTKHTQHGCVKFKNFQCSREACIRSPNVRISWSSIEGAVIISSIFMVLKNLLQFVWSQLVMLNLPQIIIKSNYLIYEPIIYENLNWVQPQYALLGNFVKKKKREREREIKE